jgi:hypothetical protein
MISVCGSAVTSDTWRLFLRKNAVSPTIVPAYLPRQRCNATGAQRALHWNFPTIILRFPRHPSTHPEGTD